MALAPGTPLGPYEVTAQIGEGGMGVVYRATDTNLGRQVAIKVLPEAFAHDPDRLARFEREARTLASLNHPNIAQIHGLEKSGGTIALVMELVEGPTLADRIAQGAIPVDEALPIATQIAEALDAAHEQGIIHRDLKPANIKVRADGMVKVLDFGLAKAMEPASALRASAGHVLSQAATITSPAMMTGVGMILGTAAYMSPEQARGKPVDKRADIWAFGVVLFEMLTGKRAFGGDDVSETLARVIEREPTWDELPAAVPTHVGQTLRLCLRKPLRERVPDIGAVRLALEGAFETAAPQTTITSSASGGRLMWVGVALATVVFAATAVPAVRHLRETPPPAPPETRVDIVTSATDRPTEFALSPDGRQIVFVAPGDGALRLWLRSLATTDAQPLTGTEGATAPFWAPDGRAIGFFTVNSLKRLDLGGGAPQTLASLNAGFGGTWNADDVIVFASSTSGVLMRVSATGGAPVVVTALGPNQQGHVRPSFLPDGRRFLFYVRGTPDAAGIYLGALDGSAQTRLTSADSNGAFLPEGPGPAGTFRGGGWLLWVRGGTLVAQPLDVAQAALAGEPVTLAETVAVDGRNGSALSVAATGLVAYRTSGGGQRQLTWIDRSGTARGTVGDPDGSLSNPSVSFDGRRVVVSRTVQGNTDLWLLDGVRTSRFTFDSTNDRVPVWSPDGTRIVFQSNRTGAGDLYQKLTSGAGVEERLVPSEQTITPTDWSVDGRFLVYHFFDAQTGGDLWMLPMGGDHKPLVFLKTPFKEVRGVFSPDGQWVAYHSNESGRDEIYIRPFVSPSGAGTATAIGGLWQVSTGGGIMAAWRPDGKELYYLNPEGAMMAAPITTIGSAIEPGVPVLLFPTRIVGGGIDTGQGRQYDIAPDGRFLINTELDSTTAPITLIQNWRGEAQK